MPSRAGSSFLPANRRTVMPIESLCQCPHGLVAHFYALWHSLITQITFLVSMPSRAGSSFLQYPFRNLGFMRFPEPLFAGICQNILTTANFYACS